MANRSPLYGTDWDRLLKPQLTEPYWARLQAFVEGERSRFSVYPPEDEVYTAFHVTQHARTRVVILGQDPYHGAGQAHGLAFSVPCGVPRPHSLMNIHKELQEDLGLAIPDHGNLEQWACQGVLLLNVTMTVREAAPGSHRGKGWETFTDEVIRAVDKKPDRVVFILWGEDARRRCELIDTSRHTTICSAHPSARKGFFRSKPFSRANGALAAAGREPIDWTLAACQAD